MDSEHHCAIVHYLERDWIDTSATWAQRLDSVDAVRRGNWNAECLVCEPKSSALTTTNIIRKDKAVDTPQRIFSLETSHVPALCFLQQQEGSSMVAERNAIALFRKTMNLRTVTRSTISGNEYQFGKNCVIRFGGCYVKDNFRKFVLMCETRSPSSLASFVDIQKEVYGLLLGSFPPEGQRFETNSVQTAGFTLMDLMVK